MNNLRHLLTMCLLGIYCTAAAQFSLNLPNTTATCGEIFKIPVIVSNPEDLTGLKMTIKWNNDIVKYVSGIPNSSFSNGIIDVQNPGILSFTWTSMDAVSLMENDTLLVLCMKLVGVPGDEEPSISFTDDKEDTEVIGVNGIIEPVLSGGNISYMAGTFLPIPLNCLDTVIQYTTATSCEVPGRWEEPIFEYCNGLIDVTPSHPLGTIFGVGNRTITYTAIDESGNMSTCSFVHIVQDTIAPVISNCPKNMEVNFSTDAGCDLSVTWQAPAVLERCSATDTKVSSSIQPGSFFPVGLSIVTYTATDAAGNSSSSCSFEVIVTGSDPITFDKQPENVRIPAEGGQCGAMYDWGAPPAAISGCAPVELVSNITPGSFFPLGTTVVEYVATDEIEQRAVWSFSVTVEDTIPLAVKCPTDIIVNANGLVESDNAQFLKNVSVTDCGNYNLNFNDIEVENNCSAAVTTELIRGESSLFTEGDTQMEYLLTNTMGETASCSFQISITDQPGIVADLSKSLACVDTELQLFAIADVDNFYDTWEWTGPAGFTSTEKEPLIYLTPERSGRYQVMARSSISACTAEAETFVNVVGEEGVPSIETGELIVCEGASLFLGTNESPDAFYEWTGPNNFTSDQIAINIDNAQSDQTGNYELIRTVDGCASPPANVRLIVLSELALEDDVVEVAVDAMTDFSVIKNDIFAADAPYSITVFPEPVNGQLVNNEDGTFSYVPNEGFIGVDQISYEICYDKCPDLCASSILTIRTDLADNLCSFPSYLSPNGDEANEVLLIACNDSSNAESGIIIFNQWGAKVYESFPYNNDWNGTYQGKTLPDGTYYYIYKMSKDDPNPVKNCLTIFR